MDRTLERSRKKGIVLMKISIVCPGSPVAMQPLTCKRRLLDCEVAGMTLEKALLKRLGLLEETVSDMVFSLKGDVWPSQEAVEFFSKIKRECIVIGSSGEVRAWISKDGAIPEEGTEKIGIPERCAFLKYPWDLLEINSETIGAMKESDIKGEVRSNVTIDGKIVLGKGSVLLPGVFIEGNAVIGEDCKIGPNCYIRGNTSVGNKCHIGQAVEIKNSILMDKVSVGHLSYVGDSIICSGTNFGAGTITANLRHDGKNHKSAIEGELVDTGRRKLGVITGDDVHTGIHTSIYPGRKIWAGMSTAPGEIVRKDIKQA